MKKPLIKANKFKGFVNICMFEESDSDYLFCKGVDGMKHTPTIHEFDSWEEFEQWLPESVYGKSLSEKSQEDYDKWNIEALNKIGE